MDKGVFITFEGIDGCGKSTQAQALYNNILKHTNKVILTREPGGTEISEKIREMLKTMQPSIECETLLYTAARAEHVRKIKNYLENGYIVISDRFVDSSVAYQGYGRGVSIDLIYYINEYVIKNLKIDMTFFIDISIEKMRERLLNRNEFIDNIENQNNDFYQKVRNGFFDIYNKNKDRIYLIDGNNNIETITQEIYTLTMKKIKDTNISL